MLRALGISGSEFENNCGLAHGFVGRVSRVITRTSRAKIKQAYPRLNIDYISNGVGGIFVEDGVTYDTIKDRLKYFLDQMNIGRKEFARLTGVSESLLSNMTESLQKNSFEKIYRAFPHLNPEWLEYGDGDMIVETIEEASEDTPLDRIKKLIDFLGITSQAFRSEVNLQTFKENITKRTVDKIMKRYPFVNPLWLMHGTGEMYYGRPEIANLSYAPLVSKTEYPNYLANVADKGFVDGLQKVPYIKENEAMGNIMAFEVVGEKMNDGTANAYVDGEIVLCRELSVPSLCSEALPDNHKDYVVIKEDGIHIRQIVNHDVNTASLTLHCLNSF